MKYEAAVALVAFSGMSLAFPAPGAEFIPARQLRGREVPQEHSHEQFLTTVRASLQANNPAGIKDPVFGLLGNAAGAAGQGSIANTDCLQQATADQAFTNAKAAADVPGMTAALVYRALERNTGKVGLASVACTAIQAVNPEIAALSQHQDPASEGAAAKNKAVTLELAKQIAAVGGDPQVALKSGTFAPGDLADLSGKGNTCDDAGDTVGCIFTQNLLVEDATAGEVAAAAGGAAPAAAVPVAPAVTAAPAVTSAPVAASTATAAAPATTSAAASTGTTNVQKFTGSLGGLPPPVEFTEGAARPFNVQGDTFINIATALQRSCDTQHNACADAANAKKIAASVTQCDAQNTQCKSAPEAA
ncbi:MAG: hypothetical protein M1832_000470 [Thelocarpon impressellum]|nr:MAG: hypothetical protein M1832_000470 [Thelocarpon impressellum]